MIPVPDKVSPNAWHLLALFIGTIAAIIGKAMPIGALSIVAISLVAITGVTRPGKPEGAIADALSGFSNPLIVDLVAKATNSAIQITWGQWALAALLPGLCMLLVMPLVLYFLFPPEVKMTPNAKELAQSELTKLGPMKTPEFITLGVLALMLIMWAGVPAWLFGPAFDLNATTTAWVGLSLLLVTGVLAWEDILKAKSAWDTLIWFAALVMMATFFCRWCGPWRAPMLLALVLAFACSLMMSLTHYGTGTAPIIFGSGYTTLNEWWTAGAVMSVVNLLLLVVVGGVWWTMLGYI